MKASAFDPQHAPTLSAQEGYTTWAATYDEMKSSNAMDYPLLERIQSVAWGNSKRSRTWRAGPAARGAGSKHTESAALMGWI